MGVAASSLFTEEKQLALRRGQPAELENYTVTLQSIEQYRDVNFVALQATVKITDADGRSWILRPQKRAYDKWQRQINTEVALRSTMARDLYLILGGVSDDGGTAGVQVLISPLVLWIWLGGVVMAFGGTFAMLPRLLPQRLRASSTVREKARQAVEAVNPIPASPDAASLEPESL
jgi:cytochrome c-type biogenesis protein CcmF